MSPRRACQLIEVATEASKMGKIFPILPTRESHVRALLAVEAEDILGAIREQVERERRAKQAKAQAEPMQQKIVAQPKNRNVTDTRAAELFNTNRTYVNQAGVTTRPVLVSRRHDLETRTRTKTGRADAGAGRAVQSSED